jgi:hypothetical protein
MLWPALLVPARRQSDVKTAALKFTDVAMPATDCTTRSVRKHSAKRLRSQSPELPPSSAGLRRCAGTAGEQAREGANQAAAKEAGLLADVVHQIDESIG